MITLYSRVYVTPQGHQAQQMITFSATQPTDYYRSYDYFGTHCSLAKEGFPWSWRKTYGSYAEWLLRARRCVLFADVTGLQPVKHSSDKTRQWESDIRKYCSVDHASIWTSSAGSVFLLNEPYCPLLQNPTDLMDKGFTYIEIPLNISPYCGGSLSANAPGTRSYLITNLANHNELVHIKKELHRAALFAPRWDDLSGVSDV